MLAEKEKKTTEKKYCHHDTTFNLLISYIKTRVSRQRLIIFLECNDTKNMWTELVIVNRLYKLQMFFNMSTIFNIN